MTGVEFYLVVLLIYFGTDVLAAWGLNLQYGVAGVLNFGYIANVALGAYFYGVLTLGPQSGNGGFQAYIIGLSLPPGLAILITVVVGCLFGGLIGLIGIKRLRPDYQAIVLLVVSIVALTIAEADSGLFNGNSGLSLLPNPAGGTGPTTPNGWGYVAVLFVVCIAAYLILRRFSDGPLGRSLRAVRDDDRAALAIGKNVVGLRILVQIVGGGFAALSGALLAGFIGAWSPAAWQFAETLSLLTAIIVGGVASNPGVVAGVLLIPVLFEQATQYVPGLASRPELASDLGWMITALLTIAFIWWRPAGIVPDRRPRYGAAAARARPLFRLLAAGRVLPAATGGTAARHSAGSLGEGGAAQSAAPEAMGDPAPATLALSREQRADRPVPGRGPRPGEPLLAASGVTVHFGGVRALNAVSFEAAAGAVTGLIGPNGAGKSTFVNVVSGFVKPESGQVLFNGRDITGYSPHRRARVGLVRTFQLSRQFGRLTAIENLLVARRGHPAESLAGIIAGRHYWKQAEEETVARARRLLAMFEMPGKADELAANLSGGERRMLELMRALMTDPVMLVLDEPLAGLSPRWSARFEEAIRWLRDEGISFLLIEHELGIVERLCESVVVMARGQVLSSGTMTELRMQREVQAAYVVG